MTSTKSPDYLYVVEWDDSVHRPPYTVIHEIDLADGVSPAEFEKFMQQKGFAKMGEVLTRAGAVAAQRLLTDVSGDPPLRFEDLDLDVSAFGERSSVRKYRVVGQWSRSDDSSTA
jgi:hypothetical protein